MSNTSNMYWILIIGALALLYIYLVKPLTYWSQRGVHQKSVIGQIVGNIRGILLYKPHVEIIKEFYTDYPSSRYNGMYQILRPVLIIRDPELIKQIMIKDFDHFTDRFSFAPEDIEPLWAKNLFALKGERWRDMRATLSPSFTSSKMKGMFIFINECAQQFVKHFNKNGATQVVEMKDAFTRLANDVIASTAFGISCDSLTDRDNEFYLMGKEAASFLGFRNALKVFAFLISPNFCKLLGIKIFSDKVRAFFKRIVRTNIESREKNGIVRPDMIHLLMEAKNGRLKYDDNEDTGNSSFAVIEESAIGKDGKRQKPPLTDDDMTAQALVFFFAGFESVSTLMCFLLYEIAINPNIKETLRKEIDETLKTCDGTLTYNVLLKMKYMDMVVSEALRKWTPQYFLDRACVKPYTIQPIKDGEKLLCIEKDVIVFIPVAGIHKDPEFYPNPDVFDPERFSDENKSKINPYTYLAFGSGPRSCIGTRFALLETKTILFNILSHFDVVVSKKTSVPIKLSRNSFTLASEDGFWFELTPRNI